MIELNLNLWMENIILGGHDFVPLNNYGDLYLKKRYNQYRKLVAIITIKLEKGIIKRTRVRAHIYIYVCVCVCVCIYKFVKMLRMIKLGLKRMGGDIIKLSQKC